MDMAKALEAIERVEPGLEKYLQIMKLLHKVDVSKDTQFRKKYNGFYRMRQRKAEFYKEYYLYMERNKSREVTFSEVLKHFYNKFERIEASFSSKLAATINPQLPVWDTFVLQNIGFKKPAYSSKNRLEKTIDIYSRIKHWYEAFMVTADAERLIELFDNRYKDVNVSDIKKVDLVLWQMR
ncbi:hypothetical protein MFMK1_000775 [Metallumcola ferriviriculae]|uniref:Uncharacterized protein n=1 Tax=Metallumcola ferriviriculae TaxID=3039180 RepID=A0AAU0ULD5_9FIRM|nr:hypothetical protein MFMK1_000775 [Desulfitibacteraceae bacterium MK1]